MKTHLPAPVAAADFSRVHTLFTDVDGTLTTDALLESATIKAIESLREAGVRVVLVSGRPAGWGDCWARTLPVDGVIVENGGLYFAKAPDQLIRKVYAQREADRAEHRRRLMREVQRAMKKVPGARLSSDSAYTEVNVAIDYNEEISLGQEAADQLERLLRARGIQAVRSNVHVNCWIGGFDKRTMVQRFLKKEWGLQLEPDDPRFVYAGDSFNDAPMFERFGLSVGVANVREVLDRIEHAPAYITRQREGRGFRELAREILAAIRPGR
jgi:HAD superfamily hydrolase (TIGR01484 family)